MIMLRPETLKPKNLAAHSPSVPVKWQDARDEERWGEVGAGHWTEGCIQPNQRSFFPGRGGSWWVSGACFVQGPGLTPRHKAPACLSLPVRHRLSAPHFPLTSNISIPNSPYLFLSLLVVVERKTVAAKQVLTAGSPVQAPPRGPPPPSPPLSTRESADKKCSETNLGAQAKCDELYFGISDHYRF